MTTTAPREFKVVGTRPIRHDGLDKVTGRAKYGGDVQMAGLLQAKILRSPHAHARIRSIDTSKAEALPGVKAVVTNKDFPVAEDKPIDLGESQGSPRVMAENILASQKALYVGHAVAAVAATSPHIAEEALSLIKVDYEVFPPLMTAEEAMSPNAPLIHETMTTRASTAAYARGENTGVKSNVATHIQLKRGDLELGFKEADVVVEREFTTRAVHQGYIEPHPCTAYWAPDGHVTIWESTQSTFGVRAQTAAILALPESVVKVIPMEIGGGFGGKISTYLAPVLAVLSKKTGHPVKMIMTRKEVFEATGPTSGTQMRCKIGARKDGRITAAELSLAYEAGAFPGSPVGAGAMCGLANYNLENMLVDGYDVIVDRPKTAAYRAPGSPQATFAVESVIDELAEKLGMDPMELRLKNAPKEGDRQPNGTAFPSIGCIELEQAMKAHPHYTAPLQGPNRGRGVAVGYWFNAGMVSAANISVNTDGTISLVTGSVDIGGTRVAVAMQAAEVLGLKAEDVTPTVVDTDSVGWTGVTGGSRIAVDTGRAAIVAAENVKRQMMARAALLWEIKPEEVEFKDGTFINGKTPDDQMTFKQMAGKLMQTGGPVSASVSATGAGMGGGPSYAGDIVDVEVDPETGKVEILRFTVFQDVGKAIHPSYVEGQMQGGCVQGIGWALNEEYFYNDQGVMANSSFLDYRMPISLDLPMIETVMVEVPAPHHPFGARGVGENSIVPPMAAIGNAISHAIGARMTSLPMSPGAILEAIKEKSGKK